MVTISSLHARHILDSRGNPTVEVECSLSDGSFGRAAVPSGASTGTHEALELRDNDPKLFNGKSVFKAVENVNTTLFGALKGKPVSDQRTIDQILLDTDGTVNKGNMGANAILGVSMAVCSARARSEKSSVWESLATQWEVPMTGLLPVPLMNVINGGKHADNDLAIQECMIVPTDFPSFSDALRAGTEIFHTLKKRIKDAGHITAVGDEGGFSLQVNTTKDALSFIEEAISEAGYEGKVHLALDTAASEFYEDGSYHIDGKTLSSIELTSYYEDLVNTFPIVSIEDSHAEDDWEGFIHMNERLGNTIQLVGDDLLVTNPKRITEAKEKNAVNAVLIKLNQIGTVSETVDAISMTKEHGWRAIVSHRSGETADTFIAHLAVGLATGQIKTGSLSRGERTAKYNQLLRIEEQLGEKARYESPF